MTGGAERKVEKELKLTLAGGGDEALIIGALKEAGYSVEPLPVREISDVYIDTFDWLCLKENLSLRYRVTDGKRAEYAIKGLNPPDKEGVAQRDELTVLLARPVDVPTKVRAQKILAKVRPVISPRSLMAQMLVKTRRRPYRAVSGATELELAFDESTFSALGFNAKRRAEKLLEFEAELLSGDEKALFDLSGLLLPLGFKPSEASKFKTAFERLRIKIPPSKPPEKYEVKKTDSLEAAVKKVFAWQMERLSLQIPGIKEDVDSEFVHQGRVAVRRMRSALRLFGKAVPSASREFFSGELKWLGATLGAVRDIDVFLLNLPRSRRLARAKGREEAEFVKWITRRRGAALADLKEAFASPRFWRLELRMDRFISSHTTPRRRAASSVKTVASEAPGLIAERFEAAAAQGLAAVKKGKLKDLHRLRILAKRLRYACEFVSPAAGNEFYPFIKRTVEVQDLLGELQDTVFTKGFLECFENDINSMGQGGRLMPFIKALLRLQSNIAAERRRRFVKVWKRFSSAETLMELDAGLKALASTEAR